MGAGAVKVATPTPDQPNPPAPTQPLPNTEEMSCEACSVNFTIIKRKKPCSDCGRNHCSNCLTKENLGKATKRRCTKCRLLTSGNFTRSDLMDLSIKDLRYFMVRRKIPMSNCTEKVDLVEILLRTSNNSHYQREQADQRQHLLELEERKRQHEAEFLRRRQTESQGHPSDSGPGRPSPDPAGTGGQSAGQTDPSRPAGEPQDFVTIEDIEEEEEVTEQGRPANSSSSTNVISHNLIIPEESTTGDNATGSTQNSPQVHVRRKPANLNDVPDIESIEGLTIRQLKEILATNYVNYKGCCEKFELIERVRRLWHEKAQDRERRGSSSEGDLCKICMDAVIDCVLLDCGHMVACTQCGKQMSECPVCRQYVVRVVHVFRA